jgi:hypothetical protein
LPGRGAQVDEDLGTRSDQGGGGIRTITPLNPEFGVIPDVFANGQAQPTPFPVDHRVLRGGLEVAVFVEDIVGRQQRLGADGHHATPVQQRRRIGERTSGSQRILTDKANDQPDLTHGPGQAFEGRLIGPDEGFSQEQIPGRIAREGQFGSQYQLHLGFNAAAIGLQDKPLVAGDVPDGGV